MRRAALLLLALLAALVILPPLFYTLLPEDLPELPPPGRRIEVADGVAVNAVVRGTGPPVVLVHGLPGSAYDWAPLTDALAARGLRAVAYDRVGFGHSDPRPDDDFTVAANARELLGLLESEDLRGATIVGWSYGGPVAIRAARLDPSRIGGIVLVGSGGPSDEPREPPAIFSILFSAPVLWWTGAVPPVSRSIQRAISEQAFSEGPQPDWWLPRLRANMSRPATRLAWRSEGARFLEEPVEPGAVERPILLIHGTDDRLAPFAIADWLHGHAPGSELVAVLGGSHMLPLTHTDLLADQIAAFARASAPAEE